MRLAEARRLARELPTTISVEQAGQLLGLSRSAAYEAVQRGELPVLRWGRRMVVPTAPVLTMLRLANAGGIPGDGR